MKTNFKTTVSTLESGEFFIEKDRPRYAHPSGSWKYKHPFPPGWKLLRTESTLDPDIVEVVMGVEIDQGDGRIQRGMSQFMMRRSPRGWQILPPSKEPMP